MRRLCFRESSSASTETLPTELTQKPGQPLEPDLVRESTRRLFASGLYRDIAVRAEPNGAGITLTFSGVPRFFVGRVTVRNVKSDRLTSLLEFATKLDPGHAIFPEPDPGGRGGDTADARAEWVLREQGDVGHDAASRYQAGGRGVQR